MNSQNITLRPYHNPENIDESKVPDGWRFRYADEVLNYAKACRIYRPYYGDFSTIFVNSGGMNHRYTYIVPVNP
jgi:hypothetical protein